MDEIPMLTLLPSRLPGRVQSSCRSDLGPKTDLGGFVEEGTNAPFGQDIKGKRDIVCSFLLRHKMHLQVSIVLLFVLLTGGFSLSCYKCLYQRSYVCQERCSDAKCKSAKTVDYFGPEREQADNWQRERDRIPNRIKNKHATCPGKGIKLETMSYGCALPHECKSWSLGTGCWTRKYIADCCDTNLCNKEVSDVFPHIPNGKRCYTCDEDDCSKTISCWGNEDNCFIAYETSSHQSVATKGCASKSACETPGKILGLNEGISCCEGNLCNGAQSVTTSVTMSVTHNSSFNSAQRERLNLCNGAQSVTTSVTHNSSFNSAQRERLNLCNGAQSVTQSLLFSALLLHDALNTVP
ncbi:unnamed protein product [Leuciscus chuanchicus]